MSMNNEQFEMAVRLTDHATELDEAKGCLEPHLRISTITVAREMHKLAEVLAGDRVGEIYGRDEA